MRRRRPSRRTARRSPRCRCRFGPGTCPRSRLRSCPGETSLDGLESRASVVAVTAVEVEDKVKSLKEINNAEVEITFDPTWTQEMMSDEAKLELGML